MPDFVKLSPLMTPVPVPKMNLVFPSAFPIAFTNEFGDIAQKNNPGCAMIAH